MTGRAITLTREMHAALVAARRVGAPLRHCAKAAGVPWRTLCDWLRVVRLPVVTGKGARRDALHILWPVN